ncbi:hypothetical protein BOX15_Mlig002302g1, partial [Macrostomum lignano]
ASVSQPAMSDMDEVDGTGSAANSAIGASAAGSDCGDSDVGADAASLSPSRMTLRRKLAQVMHEAVVLDADGPDGKSRVICPSCDKSLYDKAALRVHFKSVHLKIVYRCTVPRCPLWFNTKWSRNRHVANKNPGVHDGPPKPLPEGAIFADDDDAPTPGVMQSAGCGDSPASTPTKRPASASNSLMSPPPPPPPPPLPPPPLQPPAPTSGSSLAPPQPQPSQPQPPPSAAPSVTTPLANQAPLATGYLPLRQALERLVDALQRTDPSQHFAYPPLDAAGASAATVGSRPPTDLHSMRLMIRAGRYVTYGAFRRDLLAMVEAFRRRHARDPALREAAQVMSENLVALESQIVRAANGTNQFGLNPQLLANPDQPEPGTAESAAASTATVKVDQSAAASGCRDSSNQPPTTLTTLTTASQQQQRRAGGGGMTIGEQVGRLQSGTPCLVGFREDKRNRVAPFKPVYYDPFSSFGPCYDSGKASATLEDTQLLSEQVPPGCTLDYRPEHPPGGDHFAFHFLAAYARDHPDLFLEESRQPLEASLQGSNSTSDQLRLARQVLENGLDCDAALGPP